MEESIANCRVCQKGSNEVEFKRVGICVSCNKEYMRKYRKKNRAKIASQIKNWKKQNHSHSREVDREYYNNRGGDEKLRARIQASPKQFLFKQLRSIRRSSVKPNAHQPKSGPRCECNIDIGHIMELWESQQGVCAVSKLPMSHCHHDLFAVSIDRIDSAKGHIKGNIQLVCIAVNWAKRHYDNVDIHKFFDAYFEARVARDGFVHYLNAGSDHIPESY